MADVAEIERKWTVGAEVLPGEYGWDAIVDKLERIFARLLRGTRLSSLRALTWPHRGRDASFRSSALGMQRDLASHRALGCETPAVGLRDLKAAAHDRLHRIGFDVVPYTGRYFPSKRRVETMLNLGVRLVIDVGANTGQWATQVRRDGWKGDIVSLEPLPNAFRELESNVADDPRWSAVSVAAGSGPEEKRLNVAANSASSSLLPAGAIDIPAARYVDSVLVRVESLDSTLTRLGFLPGPNYLKVDAQGYELEVLHGASETLKHSVAVELELSLAEFYEGQPLAADVLRYMLDAGFVPMSLDPVLFLDGQVLQMDCLFTRT